MRNSALTRAAPITVGEHRHALPYRPWSQALSGSSPRQLAAFKGLLADGRFKVTTPPPPPVCEQPFLVAGKGSSAVPLIPSLDPPSAASLQEATQRHFSTGNFLNKDQGAMCRCREISGTCKGVPSCKKLDTRTNQTKDARELPRCGSRLCRRTTDSSTDENLTRAGTSAQ